MKLPSELRSIGLKDRGTYNLLFLLQHLAPSNTHLQRWRDAVRLRIARHLECGGTGKVIPVDRVKDLSPAEFRSRYLRTGTPVILAGAAREWPCAHRWSFESFRQRFGHAVFKLVHHKGLSDYEANFNQEYTEELNFGEFLDHLLNGGTKYLRFSPIMDMFPELVDDLDREFLGSMPGIRSLGTTFEVFIGGSSTFTPLHNEPTPFLFVNVCGIKRWPLIPNHYLAALNPPADGMGYNHSAAQIGRSDPETFPGLESVDRMEALLQPGDVFFMPSWVWHSVQNETPTIGVRCGLMCPTSVIAESPILFLIRMFAARNPTVFQALYYTVFRKNLQDRKTMLLQPRMYWNRTVLERFRSFPLVRRLVGSQATSGRP